MERQIGILYDHQNNEQLVVALVLTTHRHVLKCQRQTEALDNLYILQESLE